MGSFKLLGQRRFGPFFLVQFLGAFNDNLFKNSLVIMLAFKAASEAESGLILNLAAGLFILPFFLFSTIAGQFADKIDKAHLMRLVKLAEIAIMALGAVGFFMSSNVLLFTTLFLMGTHSAVFGPVKYSILPQALQESELMAGNSLVEMGTFLAILLGEIAGGALAHSHSSGLIAAGITAVAAMGYLASRYVPSAPPTSPQLKISWNPFKELPTLWKITRQKESIFNSVLGISWFWYFGATMLSQLPSYSRHILHGDESVVTLLLAVFSVSIGIGSILCERFSRGEIELGLVPLGALGMTVFGVDLYFISYPTGAVAADALLGVRDFVLGAGAAYSHRVLMDLGLMGMFSSFFIVPLFALIQNRSDEGSRSRLIAANNVFNSVFMVASAGVTIALIKAGLNTVDILLVTALLNAAVSIYIFTLIPEFFMRFVVWVLASTIYKLRYAGRDVIPRHGPAVIVCNHISFIDWFIITAACRRPVRFVMDHHIFETPVLGWLFRAAKAIPIAPAKEDAALKEQAFERISFELRDDNLVCIFPEGKISRDGELDTFRPGVERILARDPVPVIPIALGGLWGSFFSRKGGRAMHRMPHPSRRAIDVNIGAPMPPTTKADELERIVRALIDRAPEATRDASEKEPSAA
jgi:1-acyl-sn-glycerol-3-phosphate acyltransferase